MYLYIHDVIYYLCIYIYIHTYIPCIYCIQYFLALFYVQRDFLWRWGLRPHNPLSNYHVPSTISHKVRVYPAFLRHKLSIFAAAGFIFPFLYHHYIPPTYPHFQTHLDFIFLVRSPIQPQCISSFNASHIQSTSN